MALAINIDTPRWKSEIKTGQVRTKNIHVFKWKSEHKTVAILCNINCRDKINLYCTSL